MGHLEEDKSRHFLKSTLNDIRERRAKSSQPYFPYDSPEKERERESLLSSYVRVPLGEKSTLPRNI